MGIKWKMSRLNVKQINNLLIGNSLAMEIAATSMERRAFVTIGAYDANQGLYISKFLNNNKRNLLFYLRKYEIDKRYIENGWDVSADELVNSLHIVDIKSIEELEMELEKYIDDFSELDVEWRRDNPL